ncbi:unnamed protein product [Cuscuta epithymum]|uniref:Leucine-rich repeat-containing N-terminal plant-type domain-containing protein n=1 Tax=Cuscuta epithymum TaxID=186058 RepID=A0AAV0CUQ5_9ASTE|nr:unnamed protein product [Cuscuta epithymum]
MKSSTNNMLLPLIIMVVFFFHHLQGVVPSSDLGADKKALLQFAKNMDAFPGAGSSRKVMTGWSMKAPICTSWVGVNCSGSSSDGSRRRVVGVNLGGFGIQGAIPEKTIGRLDALETLHLENNRMTGAIPADLTVGNLPNLKHLNLSNNRFNGPIPSSLFTHFPASSFANNSLLSGPPMNRHQMTTSSLVSVHLNPQQQPSLIRSVDHSSSQTYAVKKTKFNLKRFLLVVVLPTVVLLSLLIIWLCKRKCNLLGRPEVKSESST